MNGAVLIAAIVGIAACITDLRNRTIPNWIPAAALVGGLAWHAFTAGWRGAANSALGALCGFLAFLLFYLLGGMGGGDVKLTAGFGALLGVPATFMAILSIAIIGGLVAAGASYWQYFQRRRGRLRGKVEDHIPYAPAIATGVWLTMWVRS